MQSKGFQPKHMNALIPLIAEHMSTMMSRIFKAADARKTIPMIDLAKDFSVDVVAHAALGRDLQVQKSENGEGEKGPFGLITTLRKLVKCYPVGHLSNIQFIRKAMALFYSRLVLFRFLFP